MDERSTTWVFFHVGAVPCALAAEAVESVERTLQVTPVAGAPPSVAGLASVRGRVVPALDLHRLFAQPSPEEGGTFLVTRVGEDTAALWVTSVEEIEQVGADSFQPLRLPGARSGFARRVIVRKRNRLCLALEPEQLLTGAVRKLARAA